MALTRFRPHRETYEWGILERMKDCAPNIRIDSWDVPFQESLDNCRLYVCDHLSTTFIEALAANKPTVLYWSPEANRLRPEAQPYFELLKEAGVLFDTPEAAASAVATVYDDVATWWNEPQRQVAIRKFCERFARTSPDAITIWSNELTRVSDLPSPK
jgi:putative transferase (TIGR04331 family)